MRPSHTLLLLGVMVLVCSLVPRLCSPDGPPHEPAPLRKAPDFPAPDVSLSEDVLSIHKVRLGTPRSAVEEWFGAGRPVDSNRKTYGYKTSSDGRMSYGLPYSDGLEFRHPLEVSYSAQGRAIQVSGNSLYRGNKKVTIEFEGSEIILPGVCRGNAGIAMLNDPEIEGEFHASLLMEPNDSGVSVHVVDGKAWFHLR